MTIPLLRIVSLVATLLPAVAFSLPGDPAEPDVRALVSSLPQGAEFRSDRNVYRPVGGLRAVRQRGEAVASPAPDAVPGEFVSRMGPYFIVRDSSAMGGNGKSLAGSPRVTAGSVVANVRTGQLGIADGIITAKLSDVGAATSLAAANGLTVEFVAAHIGYAFFTAPPGRDLAAAAAALAKDPRVKTAYPTVIENFAVPN